MPAPTLFVAIPLGLSLVLYLLRPWRLAQAGLASLSVLLLAMLALGLPLDEPIGWLGGVMVDSSTTVLGRQFSLEPGDRLALTYILLQVALLFMISWPGMAGRLFLPGGMASVGLLAAALFVRPFLFAAIFLELAATLAVFMLAEPGGWRRVPGEPGKTRLRTRGAFRYFAFTTLGMPFILLTGWLLEAGAASPQNTSFILQATVLLAAGFGVLLAVAPFHSWMPVVAEHAPPFASAFVFTVAQFAVVFLLLTFVDAYAWLSQNAVVYRGLTLAGGSMVLAGALFVFGQHNFGRMLGYVMMIDVGAVLLAVGLGSRPGVEAALATLALRGVALPLWAVGLDRLRRAYGGDSFEGLRGAARRYPMASAAVLAGLLSLVGFPLTAGFPGRWALLYLLAQIHPTAAILLLIGMVSVSLVCARGLAAILMPLESRPAARRSAGDPALAEGPAATAMFAAGLVLVLVLGLFPQWLLPTVANTASVFTHLGH